MIMFRKRLTSNPQYVPRPKDTATTAWWSSAYPQPFCNRTSTERAGRFCRPAYAAESHNSESSRAPAEWERPPGGPIAHDRRGHHRPPESREHERDSPLPERFLGLGGEVLHRGTD